MDDFTRERMKFRMYESAINLVSYADLYPEAAEDAALIIESRILEDDGSAEDALVQAIIDGLRDCAKEGRQINDSIAKARE